VLRAPLASVLLRAIAAEELQGADPLPADPGAQGPAATSGFAVLVQQRQQFVRERYVAARSADQQYRRGQAPGGYTSGALCLAAEGNCGFRPPFPAPFPAPFQAPSSAPPAEASAERLEQPRVRSPSAGAGSVSADASAPVSAPAPSGGNVSGGGSGGGGEGEAPTEGPVEGAWMLPHACGPLYMPAAVRYLHDLRGDLGGGSGGDAGLVFHLSEQQRTAREAAQQPRWPDRGAGLRQAGAGSDYARDVGLAADFDAALWDEAAHLARTEAALRVLAGRQ
jgi:hypothetical protein